MKVDFPFWGILDTENAKDCGAFYRWIKDHPSGKQVIEWWRWENVCLHYPLNRNAIIPIIHVKKKELTNEPPSISGSLG